MKKIYIVCILLFSSGIVSAQGGTWTWMKGDSVPNLFGNYGIQGIPAPGNNPPDLYEACQWTDLQGNFWLYGGENFNPGAEFGDLWKFDKQILEWTWVKGTGVANTTPAFGNKGIASPANSPGSVSLCAASWTDNNGNLWMFGGSAEGIGPCSILWRYDPASNEWTWMSGDTLPNLPGIYGIKGVPSVLNYPACRTETNASWKDDAGNLWIFGGKGSGTGNYLNDLWMYNIVSNEWTWMNGSNIPNQVSVTGSIGVFDPANTPGGRWSYCKWKDSAGNFLLFAGAEMGNSLINEVWKYNPQTNEWAMFFGNNAGVNCGQYCNSSLNVNPPQCLENRSCWQDNCDNFWFYGGYGYVSYGALWNYNANTNQFTWISGDSLNFTVPVYGNQGVGSVTSKPGARGGAVSWYDNTGNLWMFGGQFTNGVCYNDLWKFTVDTNCMVLNACTQKPTAVFYSSDTVFCGNKCLSFIDLSTNNAISWQWSFPGAVPNFSVSQNPSGICYNSSGSFDVSLIACNGVGCDTLFMPNFIHSNPSPVLNLGNDTTICLGDSIVLQAGSGLQTYLWQDGSTDSIFVAYVSGDFWVTVDNGLCSSTDSIHVDIAPCNAPGVNFISSDTTFCGKKCIDFTDLSTNNPTSWQWYFPGADSTSSTLQNPSNICYNSYGSFDVTLIACNVVGCDTLFIPSFITEYQLPAQPVITQSNDTLYCSPAFTYAWYNSINPGVIISANPYFTTSNGGSYFVIVSDSAGCQNSSSVFIATGISKPLVTTELFSILLNPVSDMITVILNKSLNISGIQLAIFNIIGQEIYSTSLHHHETSVSFSNEANGIYFVQLKISQGIFNKKIVVNHY